jgi:hypothetical protein
MANLSGVGNGGAWHGGHVPPKFFQRLKVPFFVMKSALLIQANVADNTKLKDNGNKFFYSRYLLNIPTEYLITYFHSFIAFSCSEIS